MTRLKLRIANTVDVAAIVAHMDRIREENPKMCPASAKRTDEARMLQLLKAQESFCLIGVDPVGQVRACILCVPLVATGPFFGLSVEPAWRRSKQQNLDDHSIAQGLMDALIAWAGGCRIQKITACVRSDNSGSMRLMESNGLEQVGICPMLQDCKRVEGANNSLPDEHYNFLIRILPA